MELNKIFIYYFKVSKQEIKLIKIFKKYFTSYIENKQIGQTQERGQNLKWR